MTVDINTRIHCVRKLWFCCGHRIVGHESKCANAHGHNYTVFVHAKANELDNVGRVIDFSEIKEKVGAWIEEFWDHSFLIYEKDQVLMPIREHLSVNKDCFICSFNPTAENMANYLLHEVCPKVLSQCNVTVYKIELCESENNKVVAQIFL